MVMIPPKPGTIWKDFKSFLGRGERHNWIALMLAMAIPAGIIYVFILDGRTNIFDDTPVVIYAESWSVTRSDEDIQARQRELLMAENERRAILRERFQSLADGLGVEYDEEAAAEAQRITEENRRLMAEIEAREGGAAGEAIAEQR